MVHWLGDTGDKCCLGHTWKTVGDMVRELGKIPNVVKETGTIKPEVEPRQLDVQRAVLLKYSG